MATVANPETARKPLAFHAQLEGLHGILTKPGEDILFLRDDGVVAVVTPALSTQVVVLGNVAEVMNDYVNAMLAGYAGVPRSRVA
jgi:hypothetical protein